MKHQPDANAIPPLVIEASRVSPPQQKEALAEAARTAIRRYRWRLREVAGKIIPKERVATCGIRTHGPTVDIRHGDGGAHIGGLHTCGSVWHCPVCAAKIAERRRQEVEELMTCAEAAEHPAYMAAFTFPHHRFQTAGDLRAVCAATWKKIIAGAPWKRACRKVNFLGFVRALEVTYGENGWHPHIHTVMAFAAGTPVAAIEEFGVWLFERWAAAIERAGYGSCNPDVWRWEPVRNAVQAGDYVVKWGADRELTQGHMKRAKGGGRTPWQLLDDAANGDKRAAALFREYDHLWLVAAIRLHAYRVRPAQPHGGRSVDDGRAGPEPSPRGGFSGGLEHDGRQLLQRHLRERRPPRRLTQRGRR